MLYCYLSDTALTPLLNYDITNYGQLNQINDANGTWQGVGQISERVLSVFNNEEEYTSYIKVDEDNRIPQKYPNVILDAREPRTRYGGTTYNYRIGSLFQGVGADEYPVGNMALHYDAYLAAKTETEFGNFLPLMENNNTTKTELAMLFNTIEYCVYSHVFVPDVGWRYYTTAEANSTLIANSARVGNGSTTKAVAGYVVNSVIIPSFDPNNDRYASVRNIRSTAVTPTIKNTIGSNAEAPEATANVYFPDYIQFTFRFSQLKEATIFRIYLNPSVFLKKYNRCTITHVVCPASPADLVNGDTLTDVMMGIGAASRYVANVLTSEVTKTNTIDAYDMLKTTNATGASALEVKYIIRDDNGNEASHYTMAFTCIFKGRKPTMAEMREAVKKIFENAGFTKEQVEPIFPDLYIARSYVLVPMYDTRVTLDTSLNIKYCTNIYDISQIYRNYNGQAKQYVLTTDTNFIPEKVYYVLEGDIYVPYTDDTGAAIPADTYYEHSRYTLENYVPSSITKYSSIINVPAYYMYVLAYPREIVDEDIEDAVPFDQLNLFSTYQPIGSTDVYWGTLSDAAKQFNESLTKIVASQINNVAPTDVEYSLEVDSIFADDADRTYLTFVVDGYSFAVMSRESYINAYKSN